MLITSRWVAHVLIACIAAWAMYTLPGTVHAADHDEVTFALNWLPVGEAAGWYTALEKGYFRDEKINVSIVRGLQSANGYDPLFLYRYGEFAGKMGLDGIVRDPAAFGPSDQAFNLLNTKYLFYEREDLATARQFVEHEGIRFDNEPVDLTLAPGMHTRISTSGFATELTIISAMGRSNHLPDGAPVVSIRNW